MKSISDKKATIEIHLQPGAKRSEVVGFKEGVLYAKVTALPQKGQANRALVELMAQTLGIPKSSVDIIRGQSSRSKVIAVQGLTGEEVREILGRDLPCKDLIYSLKNEASRRESQSSSGQAGKS
jgi:uncharacterized protein (TIGR00251 family)